MTVYSVALFVHVLGALGLFAALGIEWLSLSHLRQATTVGEMVEWLNPFAVLRRLYPASMAAILASGLYMAITRWGHVWWAAVGLVGMVLMAVIGGMLTGRRLSAISQMMMRDAAGLPPDVPVEIRSGYLWLSIRTRLAVAIGIVFLMSVKPGLTGSLVAMGVALALGAAASTRSRARARPSTASA